MPRKKRTLKQLRAQKIPYASNALMAKDIFKQRKLYKNMNARMSNTVDFWYRDTLYGRVDRDGNAIYPSESYMKQFKGTDCPLYALSFVVDAYHDFTRRFVTQHATNPVFRDEKYLFPQNFVAKKAWASTSQIYHLVADGKYKGFVREYLSDREKSRQVTSFDTFIEAFMSYLNETGTVVPFTRTGIITSLSCSPNINGLCVEFSREDYSKDLKKHDGFLVSPFFLSYKRAAEFHGFRIDINAPWRLVADLTSPKMAEYMAKYRVTVDNVFDKCYVKSYMYDLQSLKVYLRQIYNSFVVSQPRIRTGRRTTLYREQVQKSEFARYDSAYWIRTYAKIRRTEVIEKYSDQKFREIIEEANYIKKSLDMGAAISYINRQFLGQLTPTV